MGVEPVGKSKSPERRKGIEERLKLKADSGVIRAVDRGRWSAAKKRSKGQSPSPKPEK